MEREITEKLLLVTYLKSSSCSFSGAVHLAGRSGKFRKVLCTSSCGDVSQDQRALVILLVWFFLRFLEFHCWRESRAGESRAGEMDLVPGEVILGEVRATTI